MSRHIGETELRRALLTGYPDRVARRRSAGKATLASGHGAIIGRDSGVHDAEWLIALDVTAATGGANAEAIVRRREPDRAGMAVAHTLHGRTGDRMIGTR